MKSVKAIEKLMQSIFMISPGVFLSVSMILLFMIDPSSAPSNFLIALAYLREITILFVVVETSEQSSAYVGFEPCYTTKIHEAVLCDAYEVGICKAFLELDET